MSTVLNKKEYPEVFEEYHHPEYFNLKIYPDAGTLEREAGLLMELADMFQGDCAFELLGASQFLIDNLEDVARTGTHVITYLNGVGEFTGKTVLAPESAALDCMYTHKVCVHGLTKVLYTETDAYQKIQEHFTLVDGVIHFDNLVCLCMIVKNAGPLFEGVLRANIPVFDRWCILDTGSTDGTQDVIRRVLDPKKGSLHEEPFVNFKLSRNTCFDLAGTRCKFLLTLDDTYMIQGDLRSFLTEVRGDQYSDSFSLMIKSGDSDYYSNRIIKSRSGLRYVYTIHEVIPKENNINVTIPVDRAVIFDQRSDYMENRTNTRKQFDLDLLFKEYEDNPDDPRSLYYIAQTYGCMGDDVQKAKYFELRLNHPVEGYIQEKVDASFELARTYNFKLDKPWEECERMYLRTHDLDPERPESMYFLGIHWYLEKKYDTAYTYFKKAFEIGYPLHRQYSLKPTLSFHFVPKFLTEVSYYVGDSVTGEAAARLFLAHEKENRGLGESWLGIHTHLNKMPPVARTSNVFKASRTYCIVADGGWTNWSGRDILTHGVGGSETWVIEMARHMKRNDPGAIVLVFCRCTEPEVFEDVGYNPIDMFHSFIANNYVDVCIISRYTNYVPVAIKGHAQHVGVIFHDLLGNETVLPVHPKLKWLFCLTDWHSAYVKNMFPQFNVHTLNYGVSVPQRTMVTPKIKNSFIYSSFPNRGLVILLKMWPRIHERFPDSVLNLYCDIHGEWVNRVAPDDMIEIKRVLETAPPGIAYHGWVSKDTLARAWETAEYWLYPCKFQETFCLTALECAVSKTFAVTNNLAALSETVGDRGLVVHGDALEQSWQDEILSKLFRYMDGESKDELIEKNYAWSQTLTWGGQAARLASFFPRPSVVDEFYRTGSTDPFVWTNIDTGITHSLEKNTEHLKNIRLELSRTEWDTFVCTRTFVEPTQVHAYSGFEEYKKILEDAVSQTCLYGIAERKRVTDNIDYRSMLNWTVDIPENSYQEVVNVLKQLPAGASVLEIGTYVGTSLIGLLRNTVDGKGTVIDPWVDYDEFHITRNGEKRDTHMNVLSKLDIEETFYNNIRNSGLEDRVRVLKGSSRDRLLELVEESARFDFIYVDGSHKCLDVFFDACVAWRLLRVGGYILFDDFLFNKGDTLNSPFDAIVHFVDTLRADSYKVIFQGYRVCLQRVV